METHEAQGTGFHLCGCFAVRDAVSGCLVHRGGVSAKGKGLCHPRSFIVEEEELQNQLLGVFLPGACVAWLCRVCLFFTFWA